MIPMKRLSKLIAMVLCVALVGATSCATVPPPKPPAPIVKADLPQPWTWLEQDCDILRDSDGSPIMGRDTYGQVVCPRQTFLQSAEQSAELWGIATKLVENNAALQQLGELDVEDLQAENYQLNDKLTSPWRSPVLWGIIGFVVGGVTATTVVIKARD